MMMYDPVTWLLRLIQSMWIRRSLCEIRLPPHATSLAVDFHARIALTVQWSLTWASLVTHYGLYGLASHQRWWTIESSLNSEMLGTSTSLRQYGLSCLSRDGLSKVPYCKDDFAVW